MPSSRLGDVAAGEVGLAVPGHRGDLLVPADHPEPAVALVERHRAAPQVAPALDPVRVPRRVVVVEVDRRPLRHAHASSPGPAVRTRGSPPVTSTRSRRRTPPTPSSATHAVTARTVPARQHARRTHARADDRRLHSQPDPVRDGLGRQRLAGRRPGRDQVGARGAGPAGGDHGGMDAPARRAGRSGRRSAGRRRPPGCVRSRPRNPGRTPRGRGPPAGRPRSGRRWRSGAAPPGPARGVAQATPSLGGVGAPAAAIALQVGGQQVALAGARAPARRPWPPGRRPRSRRRPRSGRPRRRSSAGGRPTARRCRRPPRRPGRSRPAAGRTPALDELVPTRPPPARPGMAASDAAMLAGFHDRPYRSSWPTSGGHVGVRRGQQVRVPGRPHRHARRAERARAGGPQLAGARRERHLCGPAQHKCVEAGAVHGREQPTPPVGPQVVVVHARRVGEHAHGGPNGS